MVPRAARGPRPGRSGTRTPARRAGGATSLGVRDPPTRGVVITTITDTVLQRLGGAEGSTALAAVVAAALTVLVSCGDPDPPADTGADPDPEPPPALGAPEGGPDGVPEECLGVFVGVVDEPDLARVDRLPVGWPDPPVDATLCRTDGEATNQEVGYATSAAPAEVLDAYEAALAGAELERDDTAGYAGTLSGSLDGTWFTVQPRAGAFEIVLAG
jgi:hypothetical protein